MYALTAEQMKRLDSYAINEYKIPDILLMEHAALAVFNELKKEFTKDAKILIVCGGGNNGGDGLALARILEKEGYMSTVLIPKKLGELSKIHFEILIKQSVNISYIFDKRDIEMLSSKNWDLVIDAIFGISLDRDIQGEYADLVSSINSWKNFGTKVWSIDMPSGIDATSGEIKGVAVKADKTITFAEPKLGLYLFPGADYSGKIVVADIGMPREAIFHLIDYYDDFRDLVEILDDNNLSLEQRRSNTHKGSYGTVFVIAGSKDMAGAAMLATKSAYITGAGIVKLFTENSNKTAINAFLPEAICHTYEADKNTSKKEFNLLIKEADAILIGCGLSKSAQAKKLLTFAIESDKNLLIDADGINILSENSEILDKLKTRRASTVLTPHIGEMSRLTGLYKEEILSNHLGIAKEFSLEYKINLVLKSARTVVATQNGSLFLNVKGNNGMATGGSGDVLAGIIAGLMVRPNNSVKSAATAGVYLHALAGDKAASKLGQNAMLARDIIDGFASVLKKKCEK